MSEPKEYRLRPVSVRAMRVKNDPSDVLAWIKASGGAYRQDSDRSDPNEVFCVRVRRGGYCVTRIGDWIVLDAEGGFEVMHDAPFTAEYGPADEVMSLDELKDLGEKIGEKIGGKFAIQTMDGMIDSAVFEYSGGVSDMLGGIFGGGSSHVNPVDALEAAYAERWMRRHREAAKERIDKALSEH